MSSFDSQPQDGPKVRTRVRVKRDLSGGFVGRTGTLLGIDVCQPEGSRSHLVKIDGMSAGTFWSASELETLP